MNMRKDNMKDQEAMVGDENSTKLALWVSPAGAGLAIICLILVVFKIIVPNSNGVDSTTIWLMGIAILALLLPVLAGPLSRITSFKAGKDGFEATMSEEVKKLKEGLAATSIAAQSAESLAKENAIAQGAVEETNFRHNSMAEVHAQEETPQKAFEIPILRLLAEAPEGRYSTDEVLTKLEKEMGNRLTAKDRESYESTPGQEKWKIRAKFARVRLRTKGLLANDPDNSAIWVSTNEGREYLRKAGSD